MNIGLHPPHGQSAAQIRFSPTNEHAQRKISRIAASGSAMHRSSCRERVHHRTKYRIQLWSQILSRSSNSRRRDAFELCSSSFRQGQASNAWRWKVLAPVACAIMLQSQLRPASLVNTGSFSMGWVQRNTVINTTHVPLEGIDSVVTCDLNFHILR